MGRAPCCAKVGLHRGPWTGKEDMLLTKFIQANGEGQWRALPKKAGLLRCGKSCRLRWMNYLRPDIKRGNIAPDEEELIIRMHRLLGNRWSLIAGRLPGRTDNEIKNFWNTHLSKKLMMNGVDPKSHQPLSKNKGDATETGHLKNYRKKNRNMFYDRKNVSAGHAQPIHLPKANRYVAFPRSASTPNLTTPGIGLISELEIPPSYASDVLLSPSIDLNSPCSNTSQDSDNSSSGILCNLSPVNEFVPQSVLPQNQVNNNCSIPWPCIEGEEDWALSKFQSTEDENQTPNSSSLHIPPPSNDESKRITPYQQFISTDSDVPPPTKLPYINNKQENCSNITLQKVYEEYLELLQEDPSPDNNKLGNIIHNNDGEDMHVFTESLSSVWEILQGDDDGNMLNEENNNNVGSQPIS